MAFNPNSTIYLCNVPFDNTYKNQIYFASKSEQDSYFGKLTRKAFTDYLTVRKTLPDGSLQSSVKVDANIDSLYGYNYMMYRNLNHGSRWFYAFITKLIYINDGTTEIVFETDVYQTWRFDVQLLESYVVREHSETDEIGDNLVPESFNFQDYQYKNISVQDIADKLSGDKWTYLIACTEDDKDETWFQETFGDMDVNGKIISRLYNGTYLFNRGTEEEINTLLEKINNKSGDCVLTITKIPRYLVDSLSISTGGFIKGGTVPTSNIDVPVELDTFKFGNYLPANKKLYTSPFLNLQVATDDGNEAIYNLEELSYSDSSNLSFRLAGDLSLSPSVIIYPNKYKGVTAYSNGICLPEFPQGSFISDTYKIWLAQNSGKHAVSAVSSLASIVGGAAMIATGAGVAVGAGMIAGGVAGVANTIAQSVDTSKLPNQAHIGSVKSGLLNANARLTFYFRYRYIKESDAHTLDSFFTMFGYQTNCVKVPNCSSRPIFNYVETRNVNIKGGIPADDMRTLKAMFNNGVTFWKPTATVGDYSVDNRPK